MFAMKRMLSRAVPMWLVRGLPSVFGRWPVLASRRWSASGWHTKYWQAKGATTRVLQLVAVSCILGALLIDWTPVRQFAEEVEAKWSPAEVVPTALAEMGRDLAEAQLPIEVNDRVEQWMVRFSTSDKPEFERTLSRAGLYSDMIRGKLRARGMPEELVYLAMIESGFLTHARSHVSATGMWQFMDPTARAYGLRIDAYVDERRDPVKATDAALDYLSDLYQQYGSWYLAAAAYNAGPTRVSLAVARHSGRRAGDESLYDGQAGDESLFGGRAGDQSLYWEIVDHLPKETAQYVPKLLAATYLARYAARFDLHVTLADPLRVRPVVDPWFDIVGRHREDDGAGRRSNAGAQSAAHPWPHTARFCVSVTGSCRTGLPGDGRSGGPARRSARAGD